MSHDGFAIRNAVRARVDDGELALGINVRLVRSGEIAPLAASTGHDFLYIDVQHSVFDLSEIREIAQAALGAGLAPIVRTRSVDDPDIPVLLDTGVLGIIAPDVTTADEARRLVSATKYTPVGRRSLAGMSPHNGYRPLAPDEQASVENAATLVFCMIESRAGLEAIDEIAATPGLDGLYLGLNDYLADIGRHGAFDGDEARDALDRTVAACRANGLIPGSGGAPVLTVQLRAIRAGVRFIVSCSDIGLIRSGAEQALLDIRSAVQGERTAYTSDALIKEAVQ